MEGASVWTSRTIRGTISQLTASLLRRLAVAAIIRTGDCPAVALFAPAHGRAVLLHAGRAALTPTWHSDELSNIITSGFSRLTKNCLRHGDCAHYRINLCQPLSARPAGACARRTFHRICEHAFIDYATGRLNLVAIIRQQLIDLGVAESDLHHDGLCTHEHLPAIDVIQGSS